MITLFTFDSYQLASQMNTTNRAQQLIKHIMDLVSFTEFEWSLRDPEIGEKLDVAQI